MARNRLLVACVTACATLLAATVAATGVASAQSNGGVRVMPLGDSITDGLNVPGGYRINLWQSLVNGGYTVDFVGSQSNGPASLGDRDHQGHSGWRIDQIDANVVQWLQQATPRTVLLHIGTNDMIQNPSGAAARLSTLIDRITATVPNADVFVATIVPLPSASSAVETYNAAIPGIVQQKVNAGQRVHLVDMFNALTPSDLADGVHPNAGGYDKMADAWFAALLSVPGSIGTNTPPTTTPPVSPPPQPGGACTATYQLVNQWPGGFQAEVRVQNAQSSTLNGWTVGMTLGSGQSIVNLWNGVNSGANGSISVSNAPYNGTLASNGSTSFGYVASGNGAASRTSLSCISP